MTISVKNCSVLYIGFGGDVESFLHTSRKLATLMLTMVFDGPNSFSRFFVEGHLHSGKSAKIRESNHGSGICKEHYA